MRNDRQNLIVDITFQFALNIISYSEHIKSFKKYEMASKSSGVAHQLVQTHEKPKMQKVRLTLFINLK